MPKTFYICLNFRPTATNGVFVGFDDSTKGDSLVATPGDKGSPLKGSDWMIRLQLDQPKKSDFLITEPAPAKKPGKTKKRE